MEQTDLQLGQMISVSRGDRWSAQLRLQELEIPCLCPEDGSFRAIIDTPVAAVQLRSVIQQLTASRQQLIVWLERCWQLPSASSPGH